VIGLTARATPPEKRRYVKQEKTLVSHTRAVSDHTKDKTLSAPANRRRASQIVHDDRGNARVEWVDLGYAGTAFERAPLSIEPTPGRGDAARLTVERTRANGFDPYARVGGAHIPEPKKKPVKKDLRKLGEWIKLKRELEERRSQDDSDAE
jgi:hypothetical protein